MRMMTKTFAIAATCVALATPALAQMDDRYPSPAYVAPVAGVVAGTVVGVGLYEGWFGSSGWVAAFPTSAAGAAVTGGVVGVGTVALIDAAVQPCAGFQALLGMNKDRCVNGQYVAAGAPRRVVVR